MYISIKPPTDDQQKKTRRGKSNNNVNIVSLLLSYLHTLRT